MIHELHHQAGRHQDAAQIRRDPAWIAHDLQGGRRQLSGGARLLPCPHLILVKRQPGVTQRIIHVNFHLAVFAALRIGDLHAAAEIFWNVRARINRVCRLQQSHGKRMIHPLRAHHESEFLSADRHGLWSLHARHDALRHLRAGRLGIAAPQNLDHRFVAHPARNHPVAQRTARTRKFDQCRRHIALIHRFDFSRRVEIKTGRQPVGRQRRRVLHHRRAEGRFGILPEFFHADAEREVFIFHFAPAREQGGGDGDDRFAIRPGLRREHQLEMLSAHRIGFRLAFHEADLAFARQHVRQELADQQKNDPGMCELDADLFFRQLKPVDVRRHQIQQQQRAEQITAGNDDRKFFAKQIRTEDEPLVEIARLRVVKPLVHLGDGADEHEQNPERQQHDRQPQRGEGLGEAFKEHGKVWRSGQI